MILIFPVGSVGLSSHHFSSRSTHPPQSHPCKISAPTYDKNNQDLLSASVCQVLCIVSLNDDNSPREADILISHIPNQKTDAEDD